ncbi:MAG: cysteine desulfurase [Micavibrio sp.]|nr:cysteine desulfurase [Micavibrio sp.]
MALVKMNSEPVQWRDDFPVFQQKMNGEPLVYLDTASSAQKPRTVIDAMTGVMEGHYANIHRGLYEFSQETTASFEAVRGKVKAFINASSENEIVYTRNTTEAINLVAQSWGRQNLTADDEIILTQLEHHANIVPWQLLQAEIGFRINVVPITDGGTLDLKAFEVFLGPKVKFMGVVHISNALGVKNPVAEMIAQARKACPEIRTLVDGSQSVVHGAIDVQALDCDFFTFTGHKLYGPSGVGVLYGREVLLNTMPPYQGGGDMIETVSFEKGTTFKDAPARFEAGTPAIVDVIGLGAAIGYVSSIGVEALTAHEAELLSYATQKLRSIDGVVIYADIEEKAAVLSFNLEGAHSSDVGMILDQCGVAVRTGHHCAMPLMEALGVESTIRASFGLYNNKDDCDRLYEALIKAKKMLRV